jgi:hypothetical protein
MTQSPDPVAPPVRRRPPALVHDSAANNEPPGTLLATAPAV